MLKSKAMAKPAAADKTAVSKPKNVKNISERSTLSKTVKAHNEKNKAEAKKGKY